LFLPDSNSIRERYSSIIQIKSVGRYIKPDTNEIWFIVLGSRW